MRIENEPAYVLHRRAFGETSVTLELFTRDHGRIGALARGARRINPKSGKDALIPGALYAVNLAGSGELLQLRNFEMMQVAPNVSGERSLALLYINELLIAMLPRGDTHSALFVEYKALLDALPNFELAGALRVFERQLLDDMGYGIDFSTDSQGSEILPDALYRLDANLGLCPSQIGAAGAYLGAAALEIARSEFSRTHAHATRLMLRALIVERLQGKALESWSMIRELGAIKTTKT